jgi:two-component system sensor histidine kinase CreC
VTDAHGIVVYDSDGRDVGKDYSRWNDVYRTLRGQYGARSTRSDPGDDASTVMHVAAPLRDAKGRIVGVLTVAKPNQALAPFIARSQATVMRWGWVLMGTALAIGVLMAWWMSRQLGSLRRYANAVTAANARRHRRPPANSANSARRWKPCARAWKASNTSSSTCTASRTR